MHTTLRLLGLMVETGFEIKLLAITFVSKHFENFDISCYELKLSDRLK